MARFAILLTLLSWSLTNFVSAGPLLPRQGCQQGATSTGADGQTLTCGGDGQYYDGSGQLAQPGAGTGQSTQPATDGGQPAAGGTQPATGGTQPATGGTGAASGAGGPPAGYSVGFSTQDHEQPGQQSSCSTSCSSSGLIHSNDQIGPGGALAASINPSMLGGDVCSACGVCFNIINAGIAAPNGPGGDTPQGAANQQIKVWIVNSCLDCQPGQFDINNAPSGWNNPQVYYQQTPC